MKPKWTVVSVDKVTQVTNQFDVSSVKWECRLDGNSHIPKIVFLSLCRVNSQLDKKAQEEDGEQRKKLRERGKKDTGDLDSDDDDELSDLGDDDEEDDYDSELKKTENKSDVLPDASRVSIND